jgi:tripartite-type tricarboxylate transporter receptor subunit TctC
MHKMCSVNGAYRSGWLTIGALVLALAPATVAAQGSFPTKPVRIISPFAPGGGNDVLARTIATRLTEHLKQQVIVESRPGANGIIGTEAAARAAPDGYTLVLIPSGHAVNATLYPKLPFDPIRDFTAISLVGSSPLVLVMHPSVPVKSVKDMLALAKSRPGELTYSSAGIGSSGHLAGAQFETLTGTKMLHVPYKGSALALNDVIGGQISLAFATSASAMPHVRSGRLRALASTGAKRSPALPELPTVAEAGVPGYEASLWYGLVGPSGIPADVVRRLNTEIVAVLSLPEIRDRLLKQGVDATPSTPESFSRLLVTDIDRWAQVIKRAGVKLE